MNIQITHVIVHEPKQAREIIREATAIADEAEGDQVRWEVIFRESCRLLGQRYTFAAPTQPIQMPTMAIPGLGGRH